MTRRWLASVSDDEDPCARARGPYLKGRHLANRIVDIGEAKAALVGRERRRIYSRMVASPYDMMRGARARLSAAVEADPEHICSCECDDSGCLIWAFEDELLKCTADYEDAKKRFASDHDD